MHAGLHTHTHLPSTPKISLHSVLPKPISLGSGVAGDSVTIYSRLTIYATIPDMYSYIVHSGSFHMRRQNV